MMLPYAAPHRHLVSISEAAEYIGVNPATIRRAISRGAIKGHRFGERLIRVDLFEIDAALRPIPAAAHNTSANDNAA